MPVNAAPEAVRHIAGLDGLRGLAILSVMIYHLFHFFFPTLLPIVAGGFVGVDLFFVLSGFLITWLGINEYRSTQGFSILRFYGRRALRLLPALILFLLVIALVAASTGTLPDILSSIFSVLFYFHNWKIYFTLETPQAFGHLWSLSIEEQFYILWPIFLILLLRHVPGRMQLLILGVVIVGIALWRFYLWQQMHSWLLLYLRTDLRADAFLFGAATALIWNDPPDFLVFPNHILRALCLMTFLVLIFTLERSGAFYYQYGATIIGACAALWILSCRDQQQVAHSFLAWPWLEYFGARSYGLYIWHFPIFMWIANFAEAMNPVLPALAAVFVTLGIAELSWRCVEAPFNRLRRNLAAYRGRTTII